MIVFVGCFYGIAVSDRYRASAIPVSLDIFPFVNGWLLFRPQQAFLQKFVTARLAARWERYCSRLRIFLFFLGFLRALNCQDTWDSRLEKLSARRNVPNFLKSTDATSLLPLGRLEAATLILMNHSTQQPHNLRNGLEEGSAHR